VVFPVSDNYINGATVSMVHHLWAVGALVFGLDLDQTELPKFSAVPHSEEIISPVQGVDKQWRVEKKGSTPAGQHLCIELGLTFVNSALRVFL